MRITKGAFAAMIGLVVAAVLVLALPNLKQAASAAPTTYRELAPVKLWATAVTDPKWPGRLAGAPAESTDGRNVFNVVDPTFTAFIPALDKNAHSAVIVLPGGAFRQVSIEPEGYAVARWLAERGVAAFVVKYRLVQQRGPDMDLYSRPEVTMDVSGAPATADGIETLRQVRARAAEFGVDPNRTVAIGFSAGAHIASLMALNPNAGARPNYVAAIYGAPFAGTLKELRTSLPKIPSASASDKAPPFFIAYAQDDGLAGRQTRALYDALTNAGYEPELHVYAKGGHGFGMDPSSNTSAHFIDEFYWWLDSQGLTAK
ncbi:MAG: alpha/beta hydrolase [Alphaproteobacteria bacterium]